MTDPDTIITTMAQQREQERAQDIALYMLRKACAARAVDMYNELCWARLELGGISSRPKPRTIEAIDQLLKEIDDASH